MLPESGTNSALSSVWLIYNAGCGTIEVETVVEVEAEEARERDEMREDADRESMRGCPCYMKKLGGGVSAGVATEALLAGTNVAVICPRGGTNSKPAGPALGVSGQEGRPPAGEAGKRHGRAATNGPIPMSSRSRSREKGALNAASQSSPHCRGVFGCPPVANQRNGVLQAATPDVVSGR